jgi:hypothetical protein
VQRLQARAEHSRHLKYSAATSRALYAVPLASVKERMPPPTVSGTKMPSDARFRTCRYSSKVERLHPCRALSWMPCVRPVPTVSPTGSHRWHLAVGLGCSTSIVSPAPHPGCAHLQHGQVLEREFAEAGDVEEADLVGALLKIPLRQAHRLAQVPHIAAGPRAALPHIILIACGNLSICRYHATDNLLKASQRLTVQLPCTCREWTARTLGHNQVPSVVAPHIQCNDHPLGELCRAPVCAGEDETECVTTLSCWQWLTCAPVQRKSGTASHQADGTRRQNQDGLHSLERDTGSGTSASSGPRKLRRMSRPAPPLFSGWNCVAYTLPRPTAATKSPPP